MRRTRRRRLERAAVSVEYALIVVLIAIAIITAVTLFGNSVLQLFQTDCTATSQVAGTGGSC